MAMREIRARVKGNLMKYYFDKLVGHFYAPDAACLLGNVIYLDTRKKSVYWKKNSGRPKRTSQGKIIVKVAANREKRCRAEKDFDLRREKKFIHDRYEEMFSVSNNSLFSALQVTKPLECKTSNK